MPQPSQQVTPDTPLAVGEGVLVLWNEAWYEAVVLALPAEGVQVHFRGWDRKWDGAFPRENVRLPIRWATVPPGATLEVGETLQASWQGSWYEAEVLAQGPDGVKVRYAGWGEEHDEVVAPERLLRPQRIRRVPRGGRAKPLGAPADALPRPGELVEAAWRNGWYLAVVLEGAEDRVRLRYVGFGPEWDDLAPLERLRVGADLEVIEERPPAITEEAPPEQPQEPWNTP